MARPWMDFAVLKEQANFSEVLSRYGIAHPSTRGQVSVLCPFHEDRRPSLSVNMEANLFNCFACGAKGDILHFVGKIEQVSLPEAARIIAGECGIPTNGEKPPSPRPRRPVNGHLGGESGASPPKSESAPGGALGAVERLSLGCECSLDPEHPYLGKRGLTPELVEFFGLGYCAGGFLRGRVCIPIHSPDGARVAGFAGRWASDDVPSGVQRYLLPRGFKKRSVLFNFHRIAGAKHLVIVEGYWSVFRLHALEVPAVALMGRTLSEEQEDLLAQSGARLLTLLLDGDRPGREATEELLPRFSAQFFVRTPALSDNEAPDTVREDVLLEAVRL